MLGWNRDDCFKGKGGLCKREEKGQKKKRERGRRKDSRGVNG